MVSLVSTGLHSTHLVMTMSSIFRIMRTDSVAIVRALTDTNKGCTTWSSSMLETQRFLTLMP
eukprot:CAMPEP_0115116960 /NCGR_PEP_ID=MMETSP0227-20121206/43599_1 /TAXON_ID=89957 /ORGANISM="Polarella glacialis, Strain CCMP 1383" /LENGTH=61 /DNA_ID=CAMNT_0002517923 /DNA_START=215 /DNA_END=396 /DNA_ORIENTATION=+